MARFLDAITTVLKHEGGYGDNPNDPGGPTKYGISLRWYLEFGRDLDGDGDIDADDVRALTEPLAVEEYREHFWLPAYDSINDQRVATKVLDLAVNMGAHQAHVLVQRALNRLGRSVSVDGILGRRESVPAINACEPEVLLHAIMEQQVRFYHAIVDYRPRSAVFLEGWLDRAAWPFPSSAARAV